MTHRRRAVGWSGPPGRSCLSLLLRRCCSAARFAALPAPGPRRHADRGRAPGPAEGVGGAGRRDPRLLPRGGPQRGQGRRARAQRRERHERHPDRRGHQRHDASCARTSTGDLHRPLPDRRQATGTPRAGPTSSRTAAAASPTCPTGRGRARTRSRPCWPGPTPTVPRQPDPPSTARNTPGIEVTSQAPSSEPPPPTDPPATVKAPDGPTSDEPSSGGDRTAASATPEPETGQQRHALDRRRRASCSSPWPAPRSACGTRTRRRAPARSRLRVARSAGASSATNKERRPVRPSKLGERLAQAGSSQPCASRVWNSSDQRATNDSSLNSVRGWAAFSLSRRRRFSSSGPRRPGGPSAAAWPSRPGSRSRRRPRCRPGRT